MKKPEDYLLLAQLKANTSTVTEAVALTALRSLEADKDAEREAELLKKDQYRVNLLSAYIKSKTPTPEPAAEA